MAHKSTMKKIGEVQKLTHKIRDLEIKRKEIIYSVPDKKIRAFMKAYVRSY